MFKPFRELLIMPRRVKSTCCTAGANGLGNYIPVAVPDKVSFGPDFVAAHPHPDARPSDYYQ